mmetsp:Transcript_18604/g.45305  ORF Transcript_18604/g.45305 Transcript_18604/m.45305 type:complete len:201 (+) Transcript_18604:1306-1908(+)
MVLSDKLGGEPPLQLDQALRDDRPLDVCQLAVGDAKHVVVEALHADPCPNILGKEDDAVREVGEQHQQVAAHNHDVHRAPARPRHYPPAHLAAPPRLVEGHAFRASPDVRPVDAEEDKARKKPGKGDSTHVQDLAREQARQTLLRPELVDLFKPLVQLLWTGRKRRVTLVLEQLLELQIVSIVVPLCLGISRRPEPAPHG